MLPETFVFGQNIFNQVSKSMSLVKVEDEQKNNFPYAWAGGMNSCQYNEIDINLDGTMDLLVFDRVGNRLMPFINGGQANSIDYTFAPEYIHLFPKIYSWAIFRDYDQDGLMDIFTYSKDYPGMIVYKNISQNELTFKLVVSPYLTSFQGGGEVNILVTDVDYPGIDDVDGDGDIDILTFWGLGSFIEYHQNQSMELYGIPDSLKYVEVTQCWGRFAENEEGNEIYLDTCMNGGDNYNFKLGNNLMEPDGNRHTGSTFLLIDLDNDQDKDLLLGDVDYPNLVALINDKVDGLDLIVEQHSDFPVGDSAVNLFAMPCAAFMDVNNDGARDLLVSPFDPGLESSENKNSSWLYLNQGSTQLPEFHLETKSFLQDQMIDVGSGAYPVLVDYNGDGLLDLFVSNFGYYMYSTYLPGLLLNSVYWSNIALYENTGTSTNPQFNAVTHNFASLHHLHETALYPTFGDLDHDNDLDMICGNRSGNLMFLENIAGPGNAMQFAEPVINYFNIQVGKFSAPQLFDLDKDGQLDLIIGEEEGNLNYYHNNGSIANPDFVFVTDSLGKVNVTDPNISYYGFSTPYFFYNQAGQTRLLVGSEQGEIFYFTGIDGNLTGAFTKSDSLFTLIGNEPLELKNGIRTGAAIAELNGDGFMEMIVGNYSGGLHFYNENTTPQVLEVKENQVDQANISPNPVGNFLHINIPENSGDNLFYVEIYSSEGKLLKSQNIHLSKNNAIEVSSLKSGIYICKINQMDVPGHFSVKKFIKQ